MLKKGILLSAMLLPMLAFAEGDSVSTSGFQKENLSYTLQGGTLGLGAGVSYKINNKFSLRAEINGLDYSTDQDFDGTDYDSDLDFFSVGLVGTYRPFSETSVVRGLRFDFGVYHVDNKINVEASSVGTEINIGGAGTYTLQAGDTLTGDVGFSNISPYVGVGWDFMFGSQDQFTFSVDAGVLYVGTPDVDLTANSDLLANSPIVQADIDAEIEAIKDDIDSAKFFPVVKVGVTWKF